MGGSIGSLMKRVVTMLIEANWNNFRAKFNGREQGAFEWLCSLLFYKEHDCPTGALRYFNQPGIEAEPVTIETEVIGWQAKFITTDLASYKAKLIEAIDTAKKQHSTLTQIYFYVNLDFGRGRKAGSKDPVYKTDIEDHAKAKGILITWKTASFFESPFVCETNANIADHFFSAGASIIDFMQEVVHHTEAILAPIRSEITVGSNCIKIDRQQVVVSLKKALSQSLIVVICGEGGVGKTAVIKDFYDEMKGTLIPLFVFKATEFNVSHINQLFKEYGDFTFSDFLREHDEFKEKYIVIDSAEKLSDLEHPELFQEFLSTLRTAGWKVLFTTRQSYLDDLKYTLGEVYNVSFTPVNISGLSNQELINLSRSHHFILPQNERLLSVLQNLFYLNEYLCIYPEGNSKTEYLEFRNTIWNKQIACSAYRKGNAHRKREECFIELAFRRAVSGGFSINLDGFDDSLQQLESDEIIKFDSKTRGYFITHDIYEEWALERKIEQTFANRATDIQFFEQISDALAIRRAFRSWLSNKLAERDDNAARFIETTVNNEAIQQHWKDEAIVAALLSRHSSHFIEYFEKQLLEYPPQRSVQNEAVKLAAKPVGRDELEHGLLYRMIFLLRIACKEIDQNIFGLFGLAHQEAFSLNLLITQPKGSGWDSVITFLVRHKEAIGLHYMHVVLLLLDEWVRCSKQGATTRAAGQIALYYFFEQTKDGRFPYSARSEAGERLIRIILNSSEEIKDELAALFRGVIERKDVSNKSCYYELVTTALSSINKSAIIAKSLPNELINLANIYWTYTPQEHDRWGGSHRNDIEQYFGLPPDYQEHYPSSALQTPLSQLLHAAPVEAVNFILNFTNRAVEYFIKTNLGQGEIEEVEVYFSTLETPAKQFICHRLWMMYRGTQSGPALLESIHMALEQWLLWIVKNTSSEIAERWCLYLIKNSRSTSITAIVVSAVLAEPLKLFNIAQLLFRTESFFFFDNARKQLDMTAKSLYAMSYDPTGLFKSERLVTCDNKHRSWSLENIALNYQSIRYGEEDEELVTKRQEIIWDVLDEHYTRLPPGNEENESDKVWRLCLARMDFRKMVISTEEQGEKILVTFTPELTPELRAYSDNALAATNEPMRYLSLSVWGRARWEMNGSEYSKYAQYENDPIHALTETKDVYNRLKVGGKEDDTFHLFSRAVPPFVCAVLIRDFANTLEPQDAEFCRNILIEYASSSLQDSYDYQSGDGMNAAIISMPLLLQQFPEKRSEVKSILLFTLFDQNFSDMNDRLPAHAIRAIVDLLWKINPEDANSLFLGFLWLKPKFDSLCKSLLKEKQALRIYQFTHAEAIRRFEAEYESEISQVLRNQVTYDQCILIVQIEIDTLVNAFLMLPLDTENQQHKKFVIEVATIIAAKSRRYDIHGDEERLDFSIRRRFLPKFAQFVLSANKSEVLPYIQPFIDHLLNIEDAKDIFQEFINSEDKLHSYDVFWEVWELFYPSIVTFCKENRYPSSVIHNYLLAIPYWRDGAKEWRSLKSREKSFFERVVRDIGFHPAVLYSLAKLLNEIGSGFATDGILWIGHMLEVHENLSSKKLETNTEYYLDKLVRGYVLHNRERIRMTPQIKAAVLTILNFLLEKGSVTAYLTREHIL